MAIYISGVKGLPEQVQANKEDIEQIKEDIANIDFDAIRELTAQVGENTQDINNLENGQGVQDQAINGLGDRVTTAEGKITQLETDTQKITYNSTDDETRIQGTTRVAVIKNNRIGDEDSEIRFGTNQGIVLTQGTHNMNYDSDGKLYLDGVEITPAPIIPPKYIHNITGYYRDSTNGYIEVYFTIINNSNEVLNTRVKIANYLYNNGLNIADKSLQASGFYNFLTAGTFEQIIGVFANGTQSTDLRFTMNASPVVNSTRLEDNNLISLVSFNDVVIEI